MSIRRLIAKASSLNKPHHKGASFVPERIAVEKHSVISLRLAGLSKATVADTFATFVTHRLCAAGDPPTIAMTFSVNDSRSPVLKV